MNNKDSIEIESKLTNKSIAQIKNEISKKNRDKYIKNIIKDINEKIDEAVENGLNTIIFPYMICPHEIVRELNFCSDIRIIDYTKFSNKDILSGDEYFYIEQTFSNNGFIVQRCMDHLLITWANISRM